MSAVRRMAQGLCPKPTNVGPRQGAEDGRNGARVGCTCPTSPGDVSYVSDVLMEQPDQENFSVPSGPKIHS